MGDLLVKKIRYQVVLITDFEVSCAVRLHHYQVPMSEGLIMPSIIIMERVMMFAMTLLPSIFPLLPKMVIS